jgi:hypothetical protein
MVLHPLLDDAVIATDSYDCIMCLGPFLTISLILSYFLHASTLIPAFHALFDLFHDICYFACLGVMAMLSLAGFAHSHHSIASS